FNSFLERSSDVLNDPGRKDVPGLTGVAGSLGVRTGARGKERRVVAGITWEELRELAAFRAENGCAISLYVNLDPSQAPTAADVETRVNSQLAEAERLADERKASTTHGQREGLKADIDRIRRWFDD